MRLDKYLSDCGIDTRSKCKKYIRQGRVLVNDILITDEAFHVREEDTVVFDQKPIKLQRQLYLMFHKPAGCVCALSDSVHKTVLDYFPSDIKKRLLIVGRLDKDTEGLLFLTDDGAFVHHLMAPKKHVEKSYYFCARGYLCDEACDMVASGMDIGDETPTKPATLKILKTENNQVQGIISFSEGRYHQVKRMIKVLGGEVTYLRRISIGKIRLDDNLPAGEFRELTDKELELLNYHQREK